MQDATTLGGDCQYPNHKGSTGYQYGCRCDRCRAGWSEQSKAYRARRKGLLVPKCERCGEPVPPRHARWCSDECRLMPPAGYHSYCRWCWSPFSSPYPHTTHCSQSCKDKRQNADRASRLCAVFYGKCYCGATFASGSRKAKFCVAHRGVTRDPMFGPFLTDWPEYGPLRVPAWSLKQCESCGVAFVGSTAKRFCSDRCFRHPINDAAPESCDIVSGSCRRCGRLYVSPAFWEQTGFCSSTCNKAAKRSARKRLRRAGASEPYTLREIAERDGWVCHLCGRKVPDRKYAARDDDPTIDHLIPVSAGGDDIKSNVALAHNRCNWERGDKGLAQLRLVG